MAKFTLSDVFNLEGINANFKKLVSELNDKVFYRNSPTGEPNSLITQLDVNNQRIINLPEPVNQNEAARLKDVQNAITGLAPANLIPSTPYGAILADTVQGAINEAGSILSNYLATSNVISVSSIAELRLIDSSKYTKLSVYVSGYYKSGDGGGGVYYLDKSDISSLDNGGTIIVSADGKRWKLNETQLISLRQFGAIGDRLANDTAAVQACMTWCYTNRKAMFVPKGSYLLKAKVSVPGPMTIVGESQSPSTTPAYQQGVPVVEFVSTVVGDYAIQCGSATYARGGHYERFRIYGAGVDGGGLYLQNQGWDGCIDNVVVEGFKRSGVLMDYMQDVHVRALGIIDCGTENTYPSLNMVNGCNSVHFDRLHIEITPYMLNINNGGDISFSGCHFEVSEYPSGSITVVNRYSRHSQIIINGGSQHIKFADCLFAPNSVQGIASFFGVSPTTIGPMVLVDAVSVTFRGCSWRQTQTGKSSNMLSMVSSSSCKVEGCDFSQVYTDVNSIVLSGTTFVNNDITWLDTGGTLFYGIANAPGGSPSIIENNRLYCANPAGAAKTKGALLTGQAGSSYLFIGYNQITVSKYYKHHNTSCIAKPWLQAQTVDLTGFSGTLDLESYDVNVIFKFSVASTVNEINNACSGQRVKIWNGSAGSVTVVQTGLLILKGNVNAELPPNGVIVLEENGSGRLIEVSRNF